MSTRNNDPANRRRVRPELEWLEDRTSPAILSSQVALVPPPDPVLTGAQVDQLLQRAAAATASDDGIIAIVDRMGNILGVRVEAGVSPAITGNTAMLTFAVDGAVAEARTAAFFANNTAPLTSRTIGFISQSTITQREVEANPNDPNPLFEGPGYVAAIGLGGHFPPGIANTPPVDLFGIEHTNRDTAPANPADNRFNITMLPGDQKLNAPVSFGVTSGLMPNAKARGIGTLPGGIPIMKNGFLMGGIGVFFPGTTGYATAENSSLSAGYNPNLPDRTLEAEFIALAAVGGSTAAGFPVGTLGGIPALPGFDLPFPRIDLAGVTLDTIGPGGDQGPETLVHYAQQALGVNQGNPNSGGPSQLFNFGNGLGTGLPVPQGWIVAPRPGVNITAAEVQQIIQQGIDQANRTRAQIRAPSNETARMVLAVADSAGNIVGLYRMPDSTVFSIDVAVAKARNTAYYDDPTQLMTIDQVPGLPAGVAMTARTFRYLAQPRFPEGINDQPPGPFSILNDPGIDPMTGLMVGPRLPASAYTSVYGYDSFNPGTNFHAATAASQQNGVVFFPGSSGVYKVLGGTRTIVGGFGVSGDGVDQDDVVTAFGIKGFQPPDSLRADMFFVRGVRLPYDKFSRNPEAL